ncbi:MAG: tRNA (adenosine(37)-N6)-dimethylallyltransferase MiaA [Acholeplasmatales bacterium]|nr:MAG: tRNA (adenosine(37)-N6)-dimethylallyltransferase MiaA [Acholeplasmatales bacterium]
MIVAIVGPTAVGKTAVSLDVAALLGADIVSCDSVQVYRGLDIGSAKIPLTQRRGIIHHMIDILEPDEAFSVAAFQQVARATIDRLRAQKKPVVLIGGTGYYMKSVLHDFQFSGKRDQAFEARFMDFDNETLHTLLTQRDVIRAEKIHPNNRNRVLQALYRLEHGQPIEAEQKGDTPYYPYHMIGLDMARETLYERIDQRVEMMFAEGLIEEVESLYTRGIRGQSVEAIGYRELYAAFEGRITMDEAKAQIKHHTRRYAKKQRTYFKNQFAAKWFDVGEYNWTECMTNQIKDWRENVRETDG